MSELMVTKKYKPYPKYKDSGVEWLGVVPKHWRKIRGDSFLSYIRNTVIPDQLKDELVFHYSIPAIEESGDGIAEEGSEIQSNKFLLKGDELLVSKLNPRKSRVLLTKVNDLKIVCSTEFVPMSISNEFNRFILYLYQAFITKERISSTVQSATRSHQRANPSDIVKLWHVLPPYVEQTQIVHYLDLETAKIDTLIKKKQRLIELLEEKRQATISQAVTKGLDPNVKMKDSGIEWLGKVPAQWKTLSVGKAFNCKLGKMIQSEPKSCTDFPSSYYKALNVQWEKVEPIIGSQKMWTNSEEAKQFNVLVGDVLICEGGEVGRSGIVEDIDNDLVIFQNSLHRIRSTKRGYNKFLMYLMRHIAAVNWFDVICNKATIAHFTFEKLTSLKISLPNYQEQKQIVDFIEMKTQKIDLLLNKLNQQITKLQEYRQSLISSAVTGKIDVREEVTSKTLQQIK